MSVSSTVSGGGVNNKWTTNKWKEHVQCGQTAFQEVELKRKGNHMVARDDLGSLYLLVGLLGQEKLEQRGQRARGQGPGGGCSVRRPTAQLTTAGRGGNGPDTGTWRWRAEPDCNLSLGPDFLLEGDSHLLTR